MHELLRFTLAKLPKKSPVTSAIGYALGLWPAVLHFCDDGQLEIDNNAAERVLCARWLTRKLCAVADYVQLVTRPRGFLALSDCA